MVTRMTQVSDRRPRLIARTPAALILAAGLTAAGGASAQFSFGGLKNSLINFALRQVSVDGVFEISAEGIEQPEDGVTDLVGVKIADRDGVWLTADALSLRWNSSALLSGTLDIERLASRGLKVARRPVLPQVAVKEDAEIAQGPDRGLLDWPRAPITVRVRELALEQTFLAAGVIAPDRSVAFDATGKAQDAGDLQSAELTITRNDAVAGSIAFAFARDFSDQSLTVRLNAAEDAGGLVAALLSLPDDSASKVTLDASGPLTDWRIALEAEAQRMMNVTATGRLVATGPLDADLDVTVVSGEALSGETRAAIGDRATLKLSVAEDAAGKVEVREGRIRSSSITADATGFYDKPTGGLDFDVTLDVASALAEPIEGVDFQRFGFDGTLGGTVEAFQAKGDIALDGLKTAPADLGSARLKGEVGMNGDVISASLSGSADGVRADRLGPELMGHTGIEISGSWDQAAQKASLARASIASPLLTVTAVGTADVGGDVADLKWSLTTPELAPVAAAYGADAAGQVSAEGEATGKLSAPRLVGQLKADGLRYGAERFGAVSLDHDMTLGDAIAGEIRMDATGGRFGAMTVATGFTMAGADLTIRDLHAAALGATLDGGAEIATAAPLVEGRFALSAPDLAALAPVFEMLDLGAPPAGGIAGDIVLERDEGRQNASVGLTGTALAAMGYGAEGVTIDVKAFDALSERAYATGEVSARGLRGPDGLAIASVAFDGRADDLKGSPRAKGVLTATRIEGPQQIRIASVKLDGSASDLTGAVAAKGLLTAQGIEGPEGARIATLKLDGAGTNLAASPDIDAVLTAEGVAGPGGIAARSVKIDGKARDLLGAGLADAVLTVDGLDGPGLSAKTAAARVDARGVTGDPAARLTAEIGGLAAGGAQVASVKIDADLTGLASAPRGTARLAAGRIDVGGAAIPSALLNATLTDGGAGRTDVAATLTAPGLAAAGASLGDVKVTADVRDALGAPRIAVAAGVASGTAQGAELTVFDLKAEGPLSALQLALDAAAKLPDGREGVLAFRASANVAGDPKATISQFTLDVPQGKGRRPAPPVHLALTQPLTIAVTGATTRVSGLALEFPGGTAAGDLRLAAGLSGNLGIEVADLAPLSKLLDLPTEGGALSLNADFDTGAGRAKASLAGSAIRMEGVEAGAKGMALQADAGWARGRLETSARVTGDFGEPLRMTAALPLRGGGLVPSVPKGGRIEASLQWKGQVAPLWALVPLPDHILDGNAVVDLALAGPVEAPQPRGTLQLSDGRYENLETGTILDNLTVDAGLGDAGAMEVKVRADDGAGAPVTVDASIADGNLDATIRTVQAVLVRRDDASAAISADIAANGPLASFAVTGAVTIDRAEIRLVNTLPPSVAELGDVRWKGEPEPKEEAVAEAGPSLDLTVKAPGRIFVRGRGLDSEWEADLHVTGRASAPRVRGAVERRRGELRLLSRPFVLTRGRIVFDGGTEIDPRLDVALELERDDVTGRIAVTGRASAPEIALESSPPLPEEEVLPRILFGQSRQSLTASQAAELASAAAALASGDEGTLGALRQAAGLDVLSLGKSSGGSTAVEVGTSIADGVYVGATQPVDGGTTEFEVEIEITPSISVQGATGGDGGPSVGLDWKIDF